MLARPLTRPQRQRIHAYARALLQWQRSLKRWPTLSGAADGTPFVTIYADGALRGCFGSAEGRPAERLTRAFLHALEDSRYGSVTRAERDSLAAVVSYPRSAREIDPELVSEQVEAGVEGLGVVKDGRVLAMLLPHVTRDLAAGPTQLLAHLARKTGLKNWAGVRVLAFRTEDVVVRCRTGRTPVPGGDRRARAAAWLARLVARDGAVTFEVDARKRQRSDTGVMHHGRAAVVVRALAQHGSHRHLLGRVRSWLGDAIERALKGATVESWPSDPAMQAGTLALVHMAGVDCAAALSAAASHVSLRASPWHAAQVVAALGKAAPELLWRTCVDDLSVRPWAPWTLIAARARGDARATRRVASALTTCIRSSPPNEGACAMTEVPETALTALVLEALDGLDGADARGAVERGRGFLRGLQWLGDQIPAPIDPWLADGAFPASPIADVLRCDVVAHALLALGEPRRPSRL